VSLRLSLGQPGAPLRVLCLGAHCDDIDIGCGGTLLRLLSERPGSEVRWVVFSSVPERERETRAAAEDFLAAAGRREVTVKQFRESYFPSVAASIKDEFESIKASGAPPDLILTHHRRDEHQDHRVIAELTWNTFRSHFIAEYEIPKYEGDLGQPNLFVPIPALVAEQKVELLLRHYPSQVGRSWFRPETFRAVLSLRGIECGAPDGRAEAFHCRKVVV
jgi:LmbE family N-acetylglucosaminyl deacetylase